MYAVAKEGGPLCELRNVEPWRCYSAWKGGGSCEIASLTAGGKRADLEFRIWEQEFIWEVTPGSTVGWWGRENGKGRQLTKHMSSHGSPAGGDPGGTLRNSKKLVSQSYPTLGVRELGYLYPDSCQLCVNKFFHRWWEKTRPAVSWGVFSQRHSLSQGFKHNCLLGSWWRK